MDNLQSTRCPVHGVDVRKNGYAVDEGWMRCGVNPKAKDIVKGKCLFTRSAR